MGVAMQNLPTLSILYASFSYACISAYHYEAYVQGNYISSFSYTRHLEKTGVSCFCPEWQGDCLTYCLFLATCAVQSFFLLHLLKLLMLYD